MDLAESLSPERIQIGTKAADKFDLLHEIARLAKSSPALEEYSEEVIYEALDTRERIGSTAFGRRVAIPHCSFDEIDSFVLGLIVAPEGLDFASLDGEKTHLFFFIIGPQPQRNRHIRILSTVSKLLESEEIVTRLTRAPSAAAVREVLAGRLTVVDSEQTSSPKSMVHVCVQRDGVFPEILKLFASMSGGSFAVVETRTASSCLQGLPLFSGFQREAGEGSGRIIVAYVDRAIANDLIRRIHLIVGDLEEEAGVMVAVQDLTYLAGSLDF